MSQNFRDYLLPADSDRIAAARGVTPAVYAERMLATEKARDLKRQWQTLLDAPFRGITTNGEPEPDLFSLADEGFDPHPAVAAAQALLETLTGEQRERVCQPVDAQQWRAWYNPEIPFNDFGVRLEDTSRETRAAFRTLLAGCTSPEGYQKVCQLMDANHFLGELYDLTNIMNRWSFHFMIFGTPSTTAPWGWNIYGHHVAFCCFIVGRQLIISPTFMGVEPNIIDRGDDSDCILFTEEEFQGLKLMQSLSEEQQERATLYKLMEDPAMPSWRYNFADQRHLAGAFQDNRIIPLEGICASEFSPQQKQALLDIAASFLNILPDGPRQARLAQFAQHLDNTWWCWIGGCGDNDVYYYRIQSPVIILEFDHHNGMWLTNEQPAKFHIHTIIRTPNGNDYGRELLKEYNKAEK
ncbi:TPA: DUF3500 domain-containing protein [Klebsiella pneumoniae]|nr:DUF3500 domain-containing protein [Klebsiella pneumoniae]